MKFPKCPSCGHEVYVKNAKTCQFCGAEFRKTPTTVQSNDSSGRTKKIIITALLAFLLSSGILSYVIGTINTDASGEAGSTASAVTPECDEDCSRHMSDILDRQQEYFRANGSYAEWKEFQRTYPELEAYCPSSDITYDMSVQGETIELECQTCGLIEVR